MNKIVILPAPADKIVSAFVDKLNQVEPKFIDGIYLTGSIPMNDFYSNKSDIDFLVLCKRLPDEAIISQLRKIHKAMNRHYQKPGLSGSYLTTDSIQSDNPENIKTLLYHGGYFRYTTFEMAAISLSELKINAITISGQKAESLPVHISEMVLARFLYDNINSYWSKWIKQYSSVFSRKVLLLFLPRLTEWAVLGVARQLCTLCTGKIVSKKEAGIYCLEQLPDKFNYIINKAIEIRKDNRAYPFVKSYTIRLSFVRMKHTIDCVNYIINLFNQTYNKKYKQA